MDEETVLISVRIDENEVEDKIKALTEGKALLTKELKDLEREYKKGQITAAEYANSQVEITKQLRATDASLKVNKKSLADFEKQERAAAGSIDEMRSQIALLTPQYNALSKAERLGTDSGKALGKQIRELSDELKENERAVGDNRRNVGNYIRDLNVLGVNVGATADSFQEGVEGAKVFAASIFTTRGALVALTAIPIVLFLTAIVAFLKSTDAGADKLQQTFVGLTAGVDAVFKTIAPLGELLVETFTNPIDAVKKLTLALLDPIGSLKQLAANSQKMADDISTNFATAAAAAVTYTRQIQNIEDSENSLIAQRERVGLQVDQALLKVKDRNLSEAERIRILQAAGKAESDLAQKTLINARDRLAATLQQNIAIQRSRTLTDDELVAQLEAEAALVAAKRASLNTQQAITNRTSALKEQEAADDKARAAEAKERAKTAAQDRVYEAQLALIQARKKGIDTLAIEEEVLVRQGALEASGLKRNSAQRKLIEAQTNASILELRTNHLAEIAARAVAGQQSEINATLAYVQKGTKQELNLRIEALRASLRTQQIENKKNLDNRLIDANEYAKKEGELTATNARAIEEATQTYERNRVNREAEIAQLRVQTNLDLSENLLAIRRNEATTQINIEEQKQLDLLKLEELADDERLVRQNAIQARAQAQRKEVFRQILADERADRKALLEAALDSVREGTRAEFDLKRKLLKAQRDEELANTELSEKQKAAIRAKYNKADEDLSKSRIQKIFDDSVQVAQAATSTLGKFIDGLSSAQLGRLEEEQTAALSSAALSADARLAIERKFQKKKEALEKDAAEKRRKIASVENIINTSVAAVKAFSTAGPILGPILAALAVATGIANQIIIDNQKFADGGVFRSRGGGYVSGPGSGRSDSINARLSNGESVLTAKATADNYALLSSLNVRGGGKPFPGLGATGINPADLPTGFAAGGVMQVDSVIIAEAVRAGLMGVNIRVGVDEITRAQDSVKRAETRADF